MYHETRSVYSDIHLPEKNNLTTPRPITDLGIRKVLDKDEDLKNVKVPPKDEKILALMTKKGEWERDYWKKQLHNSVAWAAEKEEHDSVQREKERTHRMKIEITREEDRQKVYLQKLERKKQHLHKRNKQLKELEKANKATEKALKKQHKLKEEEIKKMVEKEKEHKEKQEKNWWEVNSSEYERRLQEKIEHDKKRLQAVEKRDELIAIEAKKIARENEEERLYFTERYVCYEKKLKESQKTLVAQIERRLTTAQSNYENVKKEKLADIKKDIEKEDERLQHALKTQSKLEKQNAKRLKKMLRKTNENIEHAKEKVSKTLEETKSHIHDENEEKEKDHKKNMKRIRKELRKWKKQISKEIKQREEKMKEKQEERTKIMEKTRSVAHGSRVLRNKVMDKYGWENFDKKLFRVERFRSLGTRPVTQDWNTSSISLL